MISRTLAMAMGLIGAASLSQMPEFTQQYRQRLGGAVDELRTVVQRFDNDALAEGLSRDQALDRMRGAGDAFLQRRGVSETQAKIRLDNLETQRRAMAEAGPFERMVAFLRYRDADLSRRTMDDFEPAVPVTTEGVAAAGAGFLGGYFLIRMLTAPFGRRRRVVSRA